MTFAAALAASLAGPHLSIPSFSSSRTKVRAQSSSSCALPLTSRRRDIQRQWRVQSQSDQAPGSSKTEDKPTENEPTPSWAKPGTEELPPWARNEAAAPVDSSGDLPFPVYLIGSCLVAIAAVCFPFLFSSNLCPGLQFFHPALVLSAVPVVLFFLPKRARNVLIRNNRGLICSKNTNLHRTCGSQNASWKHDS